MKADSFSEVLPQITAAELRQNLAALIARVKEEPVALVYHRQQVGVLLSIREYQRLLDAAEVALPAIR